MDFSELTAFLDKQTEKRIPGVDCVVYQNGKQLYRHSSGYADIESKRKVSENDLFFLYSCSKPIVCTAALRLYEKNKFSMDMPLYDFIPEFRNMHIAQKDKDGNEYYVKAKNPILIKHLFSMTAGLSYNIGADSIVDEKKKTNGKCPTLDTVRRIAEIPLHYEPGTSWEYSFGHDVLGGLIEAVSGMKLRDYIKQNIFEPLSMNDSTFHISESMLPRMYSQYSWNEERQEPQKIDLVNCYELGYEYDSGGAGIISSVNDYIKFADMMSNKGLAANGERIISEKTVDLMRTPVTEKEITEYCRWPGLEGYKYGYGVRVMCNPERGNSYSPKGEFGWCGWAGCYTVFDPENRLSLFYSQQIIPSNESYTQPMLRNLLYRAMSK